MELSVRDGLRLRMASLLLAQRAGGGLPPAGHGDAVPGPAEVVTWFGAMQAQDLASGLWSLGVRLPGRSVLDVEGALERGEVLRTWPMRGTIHLVPPRDAHWMLDLMGARALAGAAKRREFLGLDAATADRAVEVLAEAVGAAGRLTRSQCVQALTDAGIVGAGNYGYHLLWYASQRGVTCIGPNHGKEQTFVILDSWVGEPVRPERDEALGLIATRYFRSHGPTTARDLAGWTGLPLRDITRGIAVAGDRLTEVTVDGQRLYLDAEAADLSTAVEPPEPDVLALPGFDEYLLGFKDRTWMVAPEQAHAIIPGGNGVFRATLVREGRVIATWTRSIGRSAVTVTVLPLVSLGARDRQQAERALADYARFLDRSLVITWPDV